ncbi:hypothetical protein SCA6_019666 [Theobroma cacao]
MNVTIKQVFGTLMKNKTGTIASSVFYLRVLPIKERCYQELRAFCLTLKGQKESQRTFNHCMLLLFFDLVDAGFKVESILFNSERSEGKPENM